MHSKKHGHGKHILLMILGCLVPIILILALRGTGFNMGNLLGGNWYWLLFMICPLMHIFMMKGMMKGHNDDCHSDEKDTIKEEKQVASPSSNNN